MSFIYDRLYGKMDFPKIVRKLLSCPGILRLRQIGMGNIKFVSFPSFSAVTRYEHSLGVCHLADLASKSLGLSEKERIELMTAALYHDVTTPPFAHAMEEILESHCHFDHEKYFYELITGRSRDLGGPYAQIYQGKALKLPTVFQTAEARRTKLDLFRIPKLVFGDESIPLSTLISGDIDLDNIDNIIRVATAMGIDVAGKPLAEMLAKSFTFYEGDKTAISETARSHVEQWKRLRRILYDMILCSIEDFSLQTMLKHAIRCLVESSDENIRLHEWDWKLTEEQISYEKFNRHPEASVIFKRMQLKDLYENLILVWIKGPDVYKHIKEKSQHLEELSKEVFRVQTAVNYYLDSRHRDIERLFVFFDRVYRSKNSTIKEPNLLVGFFTPNKTSFIDKKTKKRFISKQLREGFFHRLREELPSYLSLYRITITQNKYPHIELGQEIT